MDPMRILKSGLKSAIPWGLLLASLSFFILVVSQKSYKSNIDILVVQNQEGFSDYFALSKSADYLSGVLLESVYSEKFLEEVISTGKAPSMPLPSEKNERLKEWQKIVRVRKNSNIGIINLEIFANNSREANDISQAVLQVLSEKNDLFLGRGQNIEIRLLSGPMVEKNPTVSEIGAAVAGGFFLGIVLVLAWYFYRNSYAENELKKTFLSDRDYQPSSEISFTDAPKNQGQIYPQSNNKYWAESYE
jgi:capsular polysaccharide biosynthesis protein